MCIRDSFLPKSIVSHRSCQQATKQTFNKNSFLVNGQRNFKEIRDNYLKSDRRSWKDRNFFRFISCRERKIRYIAGACIQRIGKRIRESVLRKVGKTSKKSTIVRKLEYKKQSLLKNFRICEQDLDVNQDSMAEIEFKQGPSRGLNNCQWPCIWFFLFYWIPRYKKSYCRTFSFIPWTSP